jgi:hypothetical protein
MDNALQLNKLTSPTAYTSPLQPIDEALSRIFSGHSEETRLLQTRRVMGAIVAEVSDEDLEIYLTEFQYLIDAWLDDFERQAYDGLTLKQLLQE